MAFGDTLKRIRMERGLSQDRLAALRARASSS